MLWSISIELNCFSNFSNFSNKFIYHHEKYYETPKSKINGYSIPNVNESLFVKFGKNQKLKELLIKLKEK